MKKIISVVGLVLFYVVLVVALMEGGIRLFDKAQPAESPGFFWQTGDPMTGWKLIANSSGRWFNNWFEYDTTISVNERSLRAPADLTYEKPPGVFRVIVLGDSFVEAAQVQLEQSFPQQLGKLLQEHGVNAQVINAGVGGWGNDQELIWLREEGVKYHPDLVVVAIYPRNDFMNNYQPLESANMGANLKPYFRLDNGKLVPELYPFDQSKAPPVEHKETVKPAPEIPPGPLVSTRDWLWNHSALYRYIDPRIRVVAPHLSVWLDRVGLLKPGDETKILAQGEVYVPLAYNVYHPHPDAEWQASFDVTEAILAEIKRTAAEMGAPTAALLVTAPEQVIPGYWDDIVQTWPPMKGQEWSMEFPFSKTVEILNRVQIPVVDTLESFRQQQSAGVTVHFHEDGHWTATGHALAAGLLFNSLSADGMIPVNGATVEVGQPSRARQVWRVVGVVVVVALVGSLLWSIWENGLLPWLRMMGAGVTTAVELLGYSIRRRQFFLLPVIVVLLLFGALLVIAQASVVGPFIYTLF
ncbi:MAG: DUF5989 family protein [Caldilineaceae bacterium]